MTLEQGKMFVKLPRVYLETIAQNNKTTFSHIIYYIRMKKNDRIKIFACDAFFQQANIDV